MLRKNQKRNIFLLLSDREYCNKPTYRLNLRVIRNLVCEPTAKFVRIYKTQSVHPMSYESGHLYMDQYRTCFSLLTEPVLKYSLDESAFNRKTHKIEDCCISYCPPGDVLYDADGGRACMIALRADNTLCRFDFETGVLLQQFNLGNKCKFKSIGWVEEEQRISIVSTHRVTRLSVRRALGDSTAGDGHLHDDISMFIGLFNVWPLTVNGLLEIRKSIFGVDLIDAMASSGLLVVKHYKSIIRLYNLDYILAHPKCQSSVNQTNESLEGGALTSSDDISAFTVHLEEIPPVLFEIQCMDHWLNMGGIPWLYIVSPFGSCNKFYVHLLETRELLEGGKLMYYASNDFMPSSFEPDKCYFHNDDSGRLLHVGAEQVSMLRVKEVEVKRSEESESSDDDESLSVLPDPQVLCNNSVTNSDTDSTESYHGDELLLSDVDVENEEIDSDTGDHIESIQSSAGGNKNSETLFLQNSNNKTLGVNCDNLGLCGSKSDTTDKISSEDKCIDNGSLVNVSNQGVPLGNCKNLTGNSKSAFSRVGSSSVSNITADCCSSLKVNIASEKDCNRESESSNNDLSNKSCGLEQGCVLDKSCNENSSSESTVCKNTVSDKSCDNIMCNKSCDSDQSSNKDSSESCSGVTHSNSMMSVSNDTEIGNLNEETDCRTQISSAFSSLQTAIEEKCTLEENSTSDRNLVLDADFLQVSCEVTVATEEISETNCSSNFLISNDGSVIYEDYLPVSCEVIIEASDSCTGTDNACEPVNNTDISSISRNATDLNTGNNDSDSTILDEPSFSKLRARAKKGKKIPGKLLKSSSQRNRNNRAKNDRKIQSKVTTSFSQRIKNCHASACHSCVGNIGKKISNVSRSTSSFSDRRDNLSNSILPQTKPKKKPIRYKYILDTDFMLHADIDQSDMPVPHHLRSRKHLSRVQNLYKQKEAMITRARFQEEQKLNDNPDVTVTSSGRVVRRRESLEGTLRHSGNAKPIIENVDYEDELDLLCITVVLETSGTSHNDDDDDDEGHQAVVRFHDNNNGEILQSVLLEEPWNPWVDHGVTLDRDTLIHTFKQTNGKHACYMYRLDRTPADIQNKKSAKASQRVQECWSPSGRRTSGSRRRN